MQEKADSEKEEVGSNEAPLDKGLKTKTNSLPFSVESLISKKTTCRTVYTAGPGLVLPKPVAEQMGQFSSPRTFFAEKNKLPSENFPSASDSLNEDNEDFSDKEQSTWFRTSSFSSPPRKYKLLVLKALGHFIYLNSTWGENMALSAIGFCMDCMALRKYRLISDR